MYIYIHTYIHKYIYIYIHTYISIYVYIYIYIHMYLPTYLSTYLSTYLPIFMFVYLSIYTNITIYILRFPVNLHYTLMWKPATTVCCFLETRPAPRPSVACTQAPDGPRQSASGRDMATGAPNWRNKGRNWKQRTTKKGI